MKRAVQTVLILGVLGLAADGVPGCDKPAPAGPQADPIEEFVTSMRAAEARLESVRIELETQGTYPSGLSFTTSGTLHVLRGEQPKTRASVSLSFADDLRTVMDSAQTERGITLYKDDPVFGEVFLRVSPVLVEDLAWAGTVLDRADLPGMKDGRAEAPLGSTMVDGLRREFSLAVTEKKRRGADDGVWLAGERRPGLGDVDTELPLANRVELFIRSLDHALLEVVQYRGDKVLQRIAVRSLAVDVEIPAETFVVDGHGQPLRDVEKYVPLWSQIQDVLTQAEAKLFPAGLKPEDPVPPECLRPSKRPK